jgi:hypothetical protein
VESRDRRFGKQLAQCFNTLIELALFIELSSGIEAERD